MRQPNQQISFREKNATTKSTKFFLGKRMRQLNQQISFREKNGTTKSTNFFLGREWKLRNVFPVGHR
jgi:hypothetical protein